MPEPGYTSPDPEIQPDRAFPAPTDHQWNLLLDLQGRYADQDDRLTWGGIQASAIVRLNKEFGRVPVTLALSRARETRVAPHDPYAWLWTVCKRLRGEMEDDQGATG